jgi:hypothetical protein
VVLDDGVSERIEADVNHFLARKQWYAKRGISPINATRFLLIELLFQVCHGGVVISYTALREAERLLSSRRWRALWATTYTS